MQAADEYQFVADEFKTQPVISDTYPIVMVVAFQFFHGPDADGAFRLFHLIDDLTHAGQQRLVSDSAQLRRSLAKLASKRTIKAPPK